MDHRSSHGVVKLCEQTQVHLGAAESSWDCAPRWDRGSTSNKNYSTKRYGIRFMGSSILRAADDRPRTG